MASAHGYSRTAKDLSYSARCQGNKDEIKQKLKKVIVQAFTILNEIYSYCASSKVNNAT